jgi:hypothetical protein
VPREGVLVFAALVGAGCGVSAHHHLTFRPGEFEPSLRVHGQLPGGRISLRVTREVVPGSVRELVVSARGSKRLPLYVGRTRDNRLCLGTTGRWACLHPVDVQPVFAYALQGGTKSTRDWGAIVGIAAPDVRVTVEHVFGHEFPLRLKRFPHFGWAAFASPLWLNGAPDQLHFYDRAGHRLSGFIDLAGSGPNNPKGNWHAFTPTFDTLPLDERAKRIVFSDPLVQHLLAGRRYSFEPTTAWSKCSGGTIGVILNFHIAPATFAEDWPSADYDSGSHTAYVQHVTYFKVARVTALDVSVDTNERRVVGVDPTNSSPGDPEPQVDEFSAHPVDGGNPGGGPDSGDCSSSGD